MQTPNTPGYFGKTDDQTIQNAIAAAVADGSRTVIIPRYNARRDSTQWRIEKAIRLPSDFTLILDNCYMVQETGVYDHMFTNENSSGENVNTLAGEQHDITVLGRGNVCLDGGEHNRLLEKTSGRYGMPRVWKNTMFYWLNVRSLRVENLHIENQRWWAITHVFCRDVTIKNINFDAVPHVPNMDGIDLRIGCNHFDIQNITGRTGDDVIAMTAVSGTEAGWAVEGKDWDIHDVKIRNVLGDPFIHLVIRFLNHDGNQLYNVELDTIMDVSDPVTKKRPKAAIDVGCALYSKKRPSLPGETRDITARNVYGRGETVLRLDHQMSNMTFTNVKSYGDNIDCIGTQGTGGILENVKMNSIYYGGMQQEIFVSTPLPPEKYHGTAVNLRNLNGQVDIENLVVDQVKTVFQADKDMTINVDGYTCNCALVEENITGGARVVRKEGAQ